jgi:WD40 repeat protein
MRWLGRSSRGAIRGHDGVVEGIALSSDGCRAVSSSDDQTLRVWNLEDETPPRILGKKERLRAIALSGDGGRALSGSEDRNLRVWDLEC